MTPDRSERAGLVGGDVAALRAALWQCFVLAGGDTDGARSPLGMGDLALIRKATDVVRDLRDCYEDALATHPGVSRESAMPAGWKVEAYRDGLIVCAPDGGSIMVTANDATIAAIVLHELCTALCAAPSDGVG